MDIDEHSAVQSVYSDTPGNNCPRHLHCLVAFDMAYSVLIDRQNLAQLISEDSAI